MHILIAPNSFKNSLPADAAANAILLGLQQSGASVEGECFPVGDGGDGTGDLLIKRLGADLVDAMARDPLGRERSCSFGLTKDGVAVIEMAAASGLHLLESEELDPMRATTAGTGDLIRAALERKAHHILLGIGGSATVDGGMGILTSLGMRFLDGAGHELMTPDGLTGLSTIDPGALDVRLKDTTLTILCDVANPPLGPAGAAAVFGPQKGASAEDVIRLESALQRFCAVILQSTGKDLSRLRSGGAAGAAAAGLYGLLGARLVNGIDYFLRITNFEESLSRSDLVITGEGSIDEQTLQGKAPFGVAVRAKAKGLRVIALTGQIPVDPGPLRPYFDELIPINPPGMTLTEALTSTAAHLTEAARILGCGLETMK